MTICRQAGRRNYAKRKDEQLKQLKLLEQLKQAKQIEQVKQAEQLKHIKERDQPKQLKSHTLNEKIEKEEAPPHVMGLD